MEQDLSINERLRAFRKAKGFTQKQISELLGYNFSTYSQMERKGLIPATTIKRLVEILEIDANQLLFGDEPPQAVPTTLDTTKICETIDRHLEGAFHKRYCFLDRISDRELNFIRIILCLKKNERIAVFDYANKILTNKITIL